MPGERGYHSLWGSRCYDYAHKETLRLLLSNIQWWLTEYNVDGFRFDGVSSMVFKNHAIGRLFKYADGRLLNGFTRFKDLINRFTRIGIGTKCPLVNGKAKYLVRFTRLSLVVPIRTAIISTQGHIRGLLFA